MRAGFAEIEITPPLGTHKIGWLMDLVADRILDPLYARLAVIESGTERLAFIQLDLLSIRWTLADAMRRRVAAQYGFPADRVMVSATHNHAGPAVASIGDVRRDEGYCEALVEKVAAAFGQALANLQEVRIGLGHGKEYALSYNRRVVQRDGTVNTHGDPNSPDALYVEGPIDPEVAVLAARAGDGRLVGAIVNYACHPTDFGGGTEITAGYPGVLARCMKERGCPVTLFLNGAAGNLSSLKPMEEAGQTLAADVQRVVDGLEFRSSLALGARAKTLALPYRAVTDAEVAGTARGAQRFIDPKIYDRGMPGLVARIRERGSQPAEVQVFTLDEYAYASIPAEYFVQHAMRIKEACYPRHALIVGYANGMVGYIPHRDAFARGGYETTFGENSRMAPEAGDMLADCAIALIRGDEE